MLGLRGAPRTCAGQHAEMGMFSSQHELSPCTWPSMGLQYHV